MKIIKSGVVTIIDGSMVALGFEFGPETPEEAEAGPNPEDGKRLVTAWAMQQIRAKQLAQAKSGE